MSKCLEKAYVPKIEQLRSLTMLKALQNISDKCLTTAKAFEKMKTNTNVGISKESLQARFEKKLKKRSITALKSYLSRK